MSRPKLIIFKFNRQLTDSNIQCNYAATPDRTPTRHSVLNIDFSKFNKTFKQFHIHLSADGAKPILLTILIHIIK